MKHKRTYKKYNCLSVSPFSQTPHTELHNSLRNISVTHIRSQTDEQTQSPHVFLYVIKNAQQKLCNGT